MTDLDTTGALVSDPRHVQLHDSPWLRLPSGVEVAILWDSELQLFARLGWAAADAWAREHGFRLPSVAELQERRYAGLMTTPVPLPTLEMCRANGIPFDDEDPRFRAWRNERMRSEWWCRYHDEKVLELLEAGASVINTKHHYDARRGIYGWFRGDRPIQSPYTKHSETWTSYALTTVVVRDADSDSDDVDPGGTTDPAPDSGALPEPDQWRPLLRRGMTGRDVQAWKVQLNADGHETLFLDLEFDEPTDTATREWQAERELQADGVVGPITRSAIGSPPVPVPDDPPPLVVVAGAELLPDPMMMLQAANYTRGHVGRDWFVPHSTEGRVHDWAPLGIARWCAGQNWAGHPVTPPRASWHYVVGAHPDPYNGVIQCLSEEHSAWTAGRKQVNDRSIQVEINGQAMVSDWDGPSMELSMRRAAALYARAHERWGIPIREVSTAELREARRMIDDDPTCALPERCRGAISHWDVTEVWEVPGGHQDPGGRDDRRWPWELFLGLVRGG